MKKLKILFVHQNLDMGGAERLRYQVIKCLDTDKYDLEVCCLEHKGEIGEDIEKLGYKVFCLNQRANLFNPLIFLKLYRLIKNRKYDIVQSSMFYANYYAGIAAFFAGVRVILFEEHGIYLWKAKYKVFIFIDKLLAKMTTKIIACSETVRRFISFQERIPRDKIITIYNFVDDLENGILLNKSEARKKFNFPQDLFLIGIIGYLKIEKGHKYLFQALPLLNFSDYKLLVIGNGYLEKELKEMVSRLGLENRVSFMDKSDKVFEIMKALDVLVIPSDNEGMPMVLLEAMKYFLPVVASRVSGIREVIEDGKTGILVTKKKPERIALALNYLKENPEILHNLAKEAARVVNDKYSKGVYLDKLERLYALAYD